MFIKVFKYIIAVVLIFAAYESARGQNTMYFHKELPQKTLLNPVFTSTCNYVGIPVLSSLYFNYDNTVISYNQLFPENAEGERIPDFGYLTREMHNLDLVNAELNTNLFSVGYWYKDYFFNFNITEKTGLWATAPGVLMSLAWKGNTQYVGETAEVNRLGVKFSYYREYSLSAAKWITGDLKVGVRPKLLFGKLNLNTRNESLKLHTGEENFDLDISAAYVANSSLPISVEKDEDGNVSSVSMDELNYMNLFMNGKNPGVAFDAGIMHNYSEQINLYASLVDLGIIRWRSNLNNIDVKQSIEYTGVTQEEIEDDYNIENIVDSISNSWQTNTTQKPYTTFLPVKLYGGMTYSLNNHTDLGVLSKTMYYKQRLYPSITFSYNTEFFDFLSLTASYSYRNYAFDNFGAGISVQNKSAQFYIVSDNLLAIKPLDVQNLNFRFGINLFFNCGKSKVSDRTDIPSTRSNQGCFWIERELKQKRIKK
ncbi:MAG: DUF5723 family protein [Bacteroidota bacterium]